MTISPGHEPNSADVFINYFLLVLIWELEPYIASTMLMSDKDVAIIIRINIHLNLLF